MALAFIALQQRPQWLAEVAAAHVQAFGELLPQWTQEQAAAELAQPPVAGVPQTWLAVEHGQWLGSVSLLHEDHAQIPQYSPWLASLYVQPAARGHGLGRALIAHCVAQAAALGFPRLYLYCAPALEAYYHRLGWHLQQRLQLGPMAVAVLYVVPADYPVADDARPVRS